MVPLEPWCLWLAQPLTQLHVLVIRKHQDDVGPDVPSVPLEAALQAGMGEEGRAASQKGEEGGGQQP